MKKIRAYILMVVLFIPLIYANNMEASTEKPTEQIKIIVNENGKDTTYYFEKNAEDVYEIETEERNDNSKKEAVFRKVFQIVKESLLNHLLYMG